MEVNKRKYCFIVFGLLFSGVLAFAGGKADPNTVVIGSVLPLSGPMAAYGEHARNGMELAVEEINASGGVNGRSLRIVYEDDKASPAQAVNAFKRLVSRHKVPAVIGSVTSACTQAIAPLAQSRKTVLLVPASTVVSITDTGDYIFRTCFTDDFQGIVGGNFAVRDLGAAKAAILYDSSTEYSTALMRTFAYAVESQGGEIAAVEAYSSDATDFSSQISRIKSAVPDVIYIPDYYTRVMLISKQIRDEGISVPLIGTDAWDGALALGNTNTGGELLNSFFSSHYDPGAPEPEVVNFVTTYRAKYRATPDSLAALGYDSVYLLRSALANAGAGDSRSIRDALAVSTGHYVTGVLSFDENRNPKKSAFMLEIVNNAKGNLAAVYKTTVNP
ncbi:MAG: ABC transporter substrate-binding protein [Treponema sp.]|jgi:branched-chain amino acid transport system substrate-binding protein|nr:ABC transporter substrate-binding protein [Treponema sp.]